MKGVMGQQKYSYMTLIGVHEMHTVCVTVCVCVYVCQFLIRLVHTMSCYVQNERDDLMDKVRSLQTNLDNSYK